MLWFLNPCFEGPVDEAAKNITRYINRTIMSSPQVLHDYYKILEIPREADIVSIKTSYKRLARIRHPDKNSSSTATSEFQLARITTH
jgi:DnaJ-domain-containing protein 1